MNCIIIHGCPSNVEKARSPERRTYNKHWIPWIKKKLEEEEIKVETPLMPDPWKPDYESWEKEFNKLEINEDSILVGHSCGCAFLVRWLGGNNKKVNKVILVAPWKIPEESNEIKKKFYNYSINEDIKSKFNESVIFTADDEHEDGKKSAKIFHDALGGKVIELKNHGHYILGDMGTKEFPELLKEVLE